MYPKVKLPLLLVIFFCLIAASFFCYAVSGAQTSSVEQVITLKSGFNFVSFTVTPPAKPSDLISKNSNIEDIYLYSPAAGSFLSVSEGTLTSLALGKGYIIKSKADTSVTINGPPAGTIGDINLKKGYNLLGFSKLSSTGTVNAFTKLMNASSAIEGIYKWSPVAGSFIQVVRDYEGNITMLDGSDPALKPGEAYFVKVSEDTKINYDDGVKLTKFFAGLYTDPNSDTVAASGTYDLNKVKVYAVYSDGSTVEVTSSAVFVPNAGALSGKTYTAPKYATTVVFTVSHTDAASGVKREGYFTLAVTSSGSTPVKTTSYRCNYKLAPNAKVIDEETVVTASVTATQVVLNISNSSDAPKSGDVIIGYYGDGYLRKVTAVSVQGSQAFLTTAKANMEDAFEALDYAYRGKLSTLHATSTAAAGSVESLAIGKFLRSRTVMPAPAPDRSIISKDKLKKILEHASLSITLTKADISFDPILEYDIEIGWFKLKKFRFVVGGNLVCGIEFQIDATVAADLPLKSELEIFHSQPYVFGVGPVPCSFEWDINCGVDASASVTGSYKYSNEWTFAVRIGAEYDGSAWTKFNDIKRTSSASDDYELKGAIEIKPYLNVGFALKICGLAGPKLYLEVFLSYLAEMASLDKVDIIVSAGVGAYTSFILELYSWTIAEFKAELFSYSWELYKRSIDFKVEAPSMSPAAGIYFQEQLVAITSATAGAAIRYTTDGSEPSPVKGTLYTDPVKVSSSMTIKAVAYLSLNRYSSITTANYEIKDKNDPTLARVKIRMTPGAPGTLSLRTNSNAGDNWHDTAPEQIYVSVGNKLVWTFKANESNEWKHINSIYNGTGYFLPSRIEDDGTCVYECVPNDSTFYTYDFRYARYDSKGTRLYPLGCYTLPSSDRGSFSIDDEGSGWYYPAGRQVVVKAVPAPGYLLNYIGCLRQDSYYYVDKKSDTDSVTLTIFPYDDGRINKVEAEYLPARTATVIVEPTADSITDYVITRHTSSGYIPVPENKYYISEWNVKIYVNPAAGKKIARIDVDKGSGRVKVSTNENEAVFSRVDSDMKIYIVTTSK